MRIASVLLAVAIAGGVAAWVFADKLPFVNAGDAPAADAPAASETAAHRATTAVAPVSVVAIRSVAQPLSNQATLRGRTEAARKVEIRAETAGLVASQPKRKGEHVRAGDVLCEIERGGRASELQEAKAKLAKAEQDANASSQLRRRGFSSGSDVAGDQAALETARAQIARIELDIQRTMMVAPFDGVLESDAAELGSLLSAGALCATVITLDPIKIVGFAPERLVDQIQPGLEAQARLVTGFSLPATVAFVARSADPETRTFRVEATAPNADERLRDGMTAELVLPLAEGMAHRLPASALTLDDAGRLGVRVAAEKASSPTGYVARFQPVTLLRDGADGVFVSGPPAEAAIIVVGQEFVTDGSAVEPVWRDAGTN